MNKDQIKKELAARGYDFSMVANVIGKSPSLISKVASRQARSRVVAEAIAKAIDASVAEVFPDVPDYLSSKPTNASEREAKQAELSRLLLGE